MAPSPKMLGREDCPRKNRVTMIAADGNSEEEIETQKKEIKK